MGVPEQRWRALFDNHMAFLETHRAEVRRPADGIHVQSERKEFTYLIPNTVGVKPEVLAAYHTLQIVPWANLFDSSFENFHPNGAISYMQLEKIPGTWPAVNTGIDVRIAQNKGDIYAFTDVQARGFLGTPEGYQEWAPFLHRANEKNLKSENQTFYVGYEQEKPVGIVLALKTAGIAGLYSLATLPGARKKGVGATILKKAITDAFAKGCTEATLQVTKGDHLQSFFEKLGFREEFATTLLSKKA